MKRGVIGMPDEIIEALFGVVDNILKVFEELEKNSK